MALGTNHQTTTTAATFIPELWSDETIAAYKSNLVVANLVTRLNHKGKKGDSVHIPKPIRGAANAKADATQVVLNGGTATEANISIDKHYEYSVMIEDITEVQSLSSLRKFYTDDAGFALAKQVDTDLFTAGQALNGGSFLQGSGAAWSSGTAADITDAGIRAMILTLDNEDVPMDGRALVIPPVAASDLLGISRFTEQQFIGSGDAIKTGKIGQIYGVDVYITTNCPTCTGTAGGDSTDRAGVLLHKDALVLAEQVGVRSQTQYKQEYLGDLFTSDTIYGVAELRNDAAVAFVVPGT